MPNAPKFVKDPLALEDRDLIGAVFHHILHHIGDAFNDFGEKTRILKNLSPGLRMIYFTESLDMQVQNGGFNQYFWNPSGRFAFEALESFELLGSPKYVDVMVAAIAQYIREQPKQAELYEKGTLQAFSDSYRTTSLGKADDAYYRANSVEPIDGLRATFVREHPDQFELHSLEACWDSDKCSLL